MIPENFDPDNVDPNFLLPEEEGRIFRVRSEQELARRVRTHHCPSGKLATLYAYITQPDDGHPSSASKVTLGIACRECGDTWDMRLCHWKKGRSRRVIALDLRKYNAHIFDTLEVIAGARLFRPFG